MNTVFVASERKTQDGLAVPVAVYSTRDEAVNAVQAFYYGGRVDPVVVK